MKKKHLWESYALFSEFPKKLLLIMKLSIVLAFACVFSLSASVYSQKTRLNIELQDKSIREVLKTIEQQSEFRFFFNDEYTDLNKTISLKASDKTIDEILEDLFNNTEITFKVMDNNFVVITPADNVNQQLKVTGTVKDAATDEPLPGVNVLVQGTLQGVITDVNGKYTLIIQESDVILEFSYVGFLTERISVSGQSVIDVMLFQDIKQLAEVVVVGFGTQKKVNLTGSVATVDTKMIELRPVSNVVQSLQGLVPGLNISNSAGGEMGQSPTINIRGITTIGQGSSGNPLILIDGMEGDINSLNPQDIENISVLKDAAASSIYGSRAPFGVILITTKKGKAGKPSITYDGSYRSSSPLSMPDMADSYTFALYYRDLEANNMKTGGSTIVNFTDEWLQRIKDFRDGKLPMNTYNGKQYPMTTLGEPNTGNWRSGYAAGNDNINIFKELYKPSSSQQDHTLSLSGGNEYITYYVSGNYMDAPGLMKLGGDHHGRFGVTARVNGKISEKLYVSYIGKFTREKFEQPSSSMGREDFWAVSMNWPILPMYDPNGYLFDSPSRTLAVADGGRENWVNDKVYQQFKATFEPLKGWKIIGDFNFSLADNFHHYDRQKLYIHDMSGNPKLLDGNSYVYEEVNRADFVNPDIYTEYSKIFGGHNFKVMAGFQSELYKYRTLYGNRTGILVPSSPTINTTSGYDNSGKFVPSTTTSGYANWSTAGYFGRLNYDFNGRYLVEFNLRYDGTSRFQSDQRWNLFPSASLGWNVARESFWKNLEKYVNNFKIRGSYGELGNQNTTSFYPTYPVMTPVPSSGNWLINGSRPTSVYPPQLMSSTLTWEKIRTYNAGVDIDVLNNRLKTTFDYFVRYTNDMVGPSPELPVIFGTTVPSTNNTDLQTQGFELDMSWQDRLSNGLGYNIRFTLADSRTKILEYPNPTGRISQANDGVTNYSGTIVYDRYNSGETWGNIWGYSTVGIAKTQEEMNAHLSSMPNGDQVALLSNTESGWGPGDIMYKDLNDDGKIDNGAYTLQDHGDLKVIGNITPRYSFGINLGADWKGFDFTIFFQGVMKRDYFNDSYMFWGAGRSVWETAVLEQHLDYFRDDPNSPFGLNMDSYYPRPSTPEDWSGRSMGKNHWIQTRYLQNAAYIRLKNLTIGYTLPQFISKKAAIQRLRLYVSGENIWTGTKLTKIFDPEMIDNNYINAYPLSKTYSLGVNVTF